jgi:hypothetical protein
MEPSSVMGSSVGSQCFSEYPAGMPALRASSSVATRGCFGGGVDFGGGFRASTSAVASAVSTSTSASTSAVASVVCRHGRGTSRMPSGMFAGTQLDASRWRLNLDPRTGAVDRHRRGWTGHSRNEVDRHRGTTHSRNKVYSTVVHPTNYQLLNMERKQYSRCLRYHLLLTRNI